MLWFNLNKTINYAVHLLYYTDTRSMCKKIPLASFQVSVILNGHFKIPFDMLFLKISIGMYKREV